MSTEGTSSTASQVVLNGKQVAADDVAKVWKKTGTFLGRLISRIKLSWALGMKITSASLEQVLNNADTSDIDRIQEAYKNQIGDSQKGQADRMSQLKAKVQSVPEKAALPQTSSPRIIAVLQSLFDRSVSKSNDQALNTGRQKDSSASSSQGQPPASSQQAQDSTTTEAQPPLVQKQGAAPQNQPPGSDSQGHDSTTTEAQPPLVQKQGAASLTIPAMFDQLSSSSSGVEYVQHDANSWNAQFQTALKENNRPKQKELRQQVYTGTKTACQTGYQIGDLTFVPNAGSTQALKKGTQILDTSQPVSSGSSTPYTATSVEVHNKDSLDAAEALVDEGMRPAVLNMACRYSRGGGVEDGSGAQEECIFRCTNAHLALEALPYPLPETERVAVSRGVTVFRKSHKDGYAFRDKPFQITLISHAAYCLNTKDGSYRQDQKSLHGTGISQFQKFATSPEFKRRMEQKLLDILRGAVQAGCDSIVLGAFGCGAFDDADHHNRTAMLTLLPAILKSDEFKGRFKKITFAVLDYSPNEELFRAFQDCFQPSQPPPAASATPSAQQAAAPQPSVDQVLEEAGRQWQSNALIGGRGRGFEQNITLLRGLIENDSISDEQLYQFLMKHTIRRSGGFFSDAETGLPTQLSEAFTKARGCTIVDFYKMQYLAQKQNEWKQNANQFKQEANAALLRALIEDSSLSNLDLFDFFTAVGIRHDGRWWDQTMSQDMLDKRGMIVQEFFSATSIQKLTAKYHHATEQSKKDKIIREAIADRRVLDKDLYRFLIDAGIANIAENQTKFQQDFAQRQAKSLDALFQEHSPKPAAVATTSAAAVHTISDPLQHVVTLNSHGAFSHEQFALPENVYVLAPHPQGFDVPYTLSSPPGGKTFEEMIYTGPGAAQHFLTLSSGGWRLYKPGEMVRNVHFSPWSGVSDPQVEFTNWKAKVPGTDVSAVLAEHSKTVPSSALVPARPLSQDANRKPLFHNETPKEKVKIFGTTDLCAVIAQLQQKTLPGQPIILIPFTCNFDPTTSANQSITCESTTGVNLQALFSILPFTSPSAGNAGAPIPGSIPKSQEPQEGSQAWWVAKQKEWAQNATDKGGFVKNKDLLVTLINNPELSNRDLYSFMQNVKTII